MPTGAALIGFFLVVSAALAGATEVPSDATNAEFEAGRDFSKGERLARLVKVGMTEEDVRVLFGRQHTPLRICFGTVSDTTLLAYPEYGVTVILGIDLRVRGVERRWEKDKAPPGPPPIGVGRVVRSSLSTASSGGLVPTPGDGTASTITRPKATNRAADLFSLADWLDWLRDQPPSLDSAVGP